MRTIALAGMLAGCAAPAGTPVTIDWDHPIGDVSPRYLGHNAVWSRDGLGLWDPAADAVRPDVQAIVEPLHPGVLRFPGGTRAMLYRFEETIGPVAGRRPQCDPFTGKLDGTTWGTDEALREAEALGAETSLVAPWTIGSPERTAAMVAYATASPDSTVVLGVDADGRDWETAGAWAARRAANGHPAPYRVPFLELGNEEYLGLAPGTAICGTSHPFHQNERLIGGEYVPTTAADVADQVARTAALVRAVAPDIEIGVPALVDDLGQALPAATAVAANDAATQTPWNPTILASDFDTWIVHLYRYDADLDRVRFGDQVRDALRDLKTLAPARRVAITEFGFLLDADTQLGALVTADVVRVAVEEGAVELLRHILIEDDPSGPFATSAAILGGDHERTPAYHALVMLAAALQPVAVKAAGIDDEVTVLATRDEAGTTLGVAVIDRRIAPTEAVELDVPLPPGSWSGSATTLAGVAPEVSELHSGHITLPPSGLVVISLKHN